MKSIRILNYANKSLSKSTKSLIILDSSFNPPHSAHLAMIRTALQSKLESPVSVILMYATKNADKDVKGSEENDVRIELMQAFSKKVNELCETHICLTEHPYFVDKFKALQEDVPEAKQVYIVGYDTLIRILDKKYYPDQDLSKSGLDAFFQHGKLMCALREDEKYGSIATQKAHVEDLAAGKIHGVPTQWGQNIEVFTLSAEEGRGVSSSMLRDAVAAGQTETLMRYVTPEVRQVIQDRHLYGNEISFPYLSRQHVVNCSFSQWHGKLKHVSPRARVIKPLPSTFIQYLNEDGVKLPSSDTRLISKITDLDSDSEASDFDDQDEGFAEPELADMFPELHEEIQRIINVLGGAVVPKLNWSSPKDALWITADKTLKCTSPQDIYLLLKSSDFIVHDLENAFDQCDDDASPPTEFELVLKKYFAAQPSMEFRCFIKDSRLVAVSQRDINHYDFLARETDKIIALASRLCYDHVIRHFPDPHCVFDMYISLEQDKAWVMDINPFSSTTDALLFTWPEILAHVGAPTIRLVSKESLMTHGPQYSAHQVPLELIDASDGVDPATFAEEFQRKLTHAVFEAE